MNIHDYIYQPLEVSFETLALCNARCNFCPYPTLERKGAELPPDVLDDMIEEMADWRLPFYISPFKVNEPFLDSRLLPLCRKIELRIPQAKLRLFTNGSVMVPDKIFGLSELTHVEHLWISLNSVDPAEYKEIMGLNFDNTTRKLDMVHDAARHGLFRFPVRISKVADGNHRDVDFLHYVGARWPLFEPWIIKRDGWLGFTEPGSPEIPDRYCGRWFELSIMATGTVALCCMDGKGEFPLGNVKEQSLLSIYNQPDLVRRRQMMLSRKEVFPCSTCTY